MEEPELRERGAVSSTNQVSELFGLAVAELLIVSSWPWLLSGLGPHMLVGPIMSLGSAGAQELNTLLRTVFGRWVG